jgi:radical SAM superfamily enzyme YgiQ (UPF0313 family)
MTRGCVGNCSFCCIGTIHGIRGYRRHSNEWLYNSIIHYKKKYKKFKHIRIVDDAVHIYKKDNKDFFRFLDKHDIHYSDNTKYIFFIHFEFVDEESVQILHNGGLKIIMLNIDASCERVFKEEANKFGNWNKIKDVVKLFHKYDIMVFFKIIIGYPGETLEEIRNIPKVIKELGVDFFDVNVLIPFKGTKIFNIALKDNKLGYFNDEDRDLYLVEDYPYYLKYFTKKEICIAMRDIEEEQIKIVEEKIKNGYYDSCNEVQQYSIKEILQAYREDIEMYNKYEDKF